MWGKWLVGVASVIVTLGSGALYSLYPAETSKFISVTFGVSNYTAAVDIFLGTAILGGGILIVFVIVNIVEFIRRRRLPPPETVLGGAVVEGQAGISVVGEAKAKVHSKLNLPRDLQFWGNVLMSGMIGAFLIWFGYDLLPLALSHPSIGTYGVVLIPELSAAVLFIMLGRRVRQARNP